MVDSMRGPLKILRRLCQCQWYLYISYLIHSWILHYPLPGSVFIWDFVIYIPCLGVILPLHLNYIYICIDICVRHIMGSALIYLCMLSNIIFGCTSYWVFFPIYILHIGYSSTVLLLHSKMYWYVCKCYIYVYYDMLVYFIQSVHLL